MRIMIHFYIKRPRERFDDFWIEKCVHFFSCDEERTILITPSCETKAEVDWTLRKMFPQEEHSCAALISDQKGQIGFNIVKI